MTQLQINAKEEAIHPLRLKVFQSAENPNIFNP